MCLTAVRDEQTAELLRLVPPIEAIGIGGSVGFGESDKNSDIDFFMLYSSQDFFRHVAQFPSLIRHRLPVISRSDLTLNPGFGLAYSYVVDGPIAIDYNMLCREILDVNPMRAKTTVLHDSTGYFTEFTNQAAENSWRERERLLEQAVHDYLTRLLKIRKTSSRGELLPLLYNIDKLRLIVLGLHRHLQGDLPYSPVQADKGLSKAYGERFEEQMLSTVPSPNYESVGEMFSTLRSMLLRHLRGCGVEMDQTSGWAQTEKDMADEILSNVRRQC